jgi:hypothetical protein
MYARFKVVGVALVMAGIMFAGVGAFTYLKTAEGAGSLQAFSAAQDVKLAYNDEGQLLDRGDPAAAQEIMSLLTDDWGYAINRADLNPNDPLVNTAGEYMYQMAVIAYHTLYSTQTVVLDEAVEYKGETFPAGTYEFAVDGRYWSQFDRMHPIEGAARGEAWTGTAHALIANLGVGSVTASALQMGLGIAAIAAALGLVLFLTGIGIIWAVRPALATAKATEAARTGAAAPVIA